MKKILMLLLLGIFLISFSSAFEFDNTLRYEKYDMKVTIENGFGLPLFGSDLGYIELKSHKSVSHILSVAPGKDIITMYYDFDFNDIYENGLGDVEFINMNNGEKIIKDYHFVILTNVTEDINDYSKICENDKNGTNVCEYVVTGTHKETKEEWVRLNTRDIPKGNIRIGLVTDVNIGDTIDGIWTIAGNKIDKHAVWTANLDVGLISYYKLDESTGAVIDSAGNNNATNNGSTTGVTGIINTAYNFTPNDTVITDGVSGISGADARTINFWTKSDYSGVAPGTGFLFSQGSGVLETWGAYVASGTNDIHFWTSSTDIDTGLNINTSWQMWTFVYNGTLQESYLNGVAGNTEIVTLNTDSDFLQLSGAGGSASGFDGIIDEVGLWNRSLNSSEILELYNDGNGIIYGSGIILNSPINNFTTTNPIITFSSTVTSGTIGIINVSLLIDGVVNETNTSGVEGDYIFIKTLSNGEHNWSIRSVDSDTNITNSLTRNLTIDIILPQIDVESPTDTLGYNFIGGNETLNVTFTDLNLDSCWYNYNETNITIDGCLTGVKNSTLFILDNKYNITIYANDTFGNENSTFISWNYNLTEISQTYPSTSVESSTETYTATLTYNSTKFAVITALLNLNGTEYSGTRTGSGDSAIFTTSAIMPAVTSEENKTAYWTISLTDATSTTDYNLTSHNVTISIINLSLCDATNNVAFWNFTILNESNVAEIDSTFDATFSVSPLGSTEVNEFSFSDTTGTNSTFDFCISPGTEDYVSDASIKLTKSGFVDKFYNYQDVSLTNSTREDNLYMLAEDDSTSFIVHVVYVDSSDVVGAEVRVQRYYPGTGEWLTTEILTTNDAGEAVGHLLSEDADYRFLVYQDGVSIHNSTSTKITCAVSPCTVTLTISISVSSGIEPVGDLASTLVFSDTTNIFTYTYSDSSGNFDQARLYVYLLTPSNSTILAPCNTTKTASSGVITCDISGQINGTYSATAYITRNEIEFLDKRIYGVIGINTYNSMGNDGVLWAFFIFIGIIMLGVARPSLGIIFAIAGLIIVSVLQIINIGAISIVAISAIGIILLMRVGRE